MPLIEPGLWRTTNKVEVAIQRLRSFEPPEGYYLAFSGGKDSVTLLALAQMAGVKFDAHYSITSVDPPELVQFIKRQHPEVARDYPGTTMWKSIVKHGMPPTRIARFCCNELKEGCGSGRFVLTGIRAQESNARKHRKMVDVCLRDGSKRYLHPFIDWTSQDVWEFIRAEGIAYCSLYDEGFTRLGCIMCPMQRGKRRMVDAERWPHYYGMYLRTFGKMLSERKSPPKLNWQTAQDVMDWWLWADTKHEGQGRLI